MAYGFIYGLHDPTTGELRYIGQTSRTVEIRLGQHLTPKMLNKHSYVARWLKGLVDRGLKPTTSVLAVATSMEHLNQLEVELIAKERKEGARLTNITDGGRGCSGRVFSEESKEKIAAAQRGVPRPPHTKEWCEKQSLLMSGIRTNSQEHMEMLWELRRGAKHTEETKAKISASKKGQPSPWKGRTPTAETRQKMSDSLKGKNTRTTHFAFRSDIPTEDIVRRFKSGDSKVKIAADLGVSSTFVHRRISLAIADGLLESRKRNV